MASKKIIKRFIHKLSKDEAIVKLIDISKISQNPYQMRMNFNKKKMDQLKVSIKEFGILVPIIVRISKFGYELVCGERRYQAAKELGIKQIPAIIRSLNATQMLELVYVENAQREPLTPIEEAEGIKRMQSEFSYLSDAQLSEKLGIPIEKVKQLKKIAVFHPLLKKAITMGIIPFEYADSLSRLSNDEDILLLIKTIKDNSLSLAEAELAVDKFLSKKED